MDLDIRLKAAVVTRDKLAAEAQRIEGRKEAAEKALATVEQEIRGKNLDPDTLSETVEKLRLAYGQAVEVFEQEVAAASKALAPYTEKLK